MQETAIQWTHPPDYEGDSWGPLRGCDLVSRECKHCYAKALMERFRGVEGHPYESGFDFRLAPHKLDEPLLTNKRTAMFVNSTSDFFHEDAPTEYIRDIVEVMLSAKWHIYQILTKRPERMHDLLTSDDPVFQEARQVSHIWWGVSAGMRSKGLPRIEVLKDTQVKVPWISFEPLLENLGHVNLQGIRWAVIGGESGMGFTPLEDEWVRQIHRECRKRRIPFFFKQRGGITHDANGRDFLGRQYNEFPRVLSRLSMEQEVPPREARKPLIEQIREKIESKWLGHALAVPLPKSFLKRYLQGEELLPLLKLGEAVRRYTEHILEGRNK